MCIPKQMVKTAHIHNTLRHKGTALPRVINDIYGVIYQFKKIVLL